LPGTHAIDAAIDEHALGRALGGQPEIENEVGVSLRPVKVPKLDSDYFEE